MQFPLPGWCLPSKPSPSSPQSTSRAFFCLSIDSDVKHPDIIARVSIVPRLTTQRLRFSALLLAAQPAFL